ncbi:hypothetical protein EJV47_04125 [Hymenobacter gummosus]|uniref:Uncharacterized protein n=1 Tax=Hymenobacter gummosus TaxID=1776032 RepID=A0A431U6Y6_9BACT|nr:hypothetical protein [Hymenobacter gummosus]RTQ52222.1 hypothetical protein EJV47_04125 [Hymenobacter gummosus]
MAAPKRLMAVATYGATGLLGALLVLAYQRLERWTCAEARPMNTPSHSFVELQSGVSRGNVAAYHELRTAYLDMEPGAFLPWALLMANRHRYRPAYLDVYYALDGPVDSSSVARHWLSIDPDTRQLMRHYLRKAAGAGDATAPKILAALDSREKLGPAPPDTAN